MRIFLLIIALNTLFGLSGVYGQSYKDVFKRAMAEKDLTKAGEILKEWDYTDANDPELYTSYFNYFTTKSLEKDSLKYEPVYANQALEFINEGITRFPTRFDMRIANLYMLTKLKKYDKLTEDVINLVDYSKQISNNWKGEDFKLIEINNDVLSEAVQEFQEILFAEQDSTLYDNIELISRRMIKQYPDIEQSWMNLSTLYIIKKQFDKSLEALKEGEKINPANSFLLYNIAFVYKIKGDTVNAKKYFKLTIANVKEKEEKLKDAAEEQLRLLTAAPKKG
jgi:tetratricopeptide (TPR) repeat protein